MKISRRDFLKTSTAATAAAAVSGGLVQKVLGSPSAIGTAPGNQWPGKVVINFNKNALVGTTAVQAATIHSMVDQAIMALTNTTDVGTAWKAIFPSSLTATSKIAIKVPFGFALAPCGPHWSSVRAIVDGLRSMAVDTAGTKYTGLITIYDSAGSNNLNAFGYNATNFPSSLNTTITFESSFSAYTDGVGGRAYAAALHNADFLINVFSPRGHASFGLTLGFKNHFGTYQNPSTTLHGGGIEAINSSGPVYTKTVLSMCSAIYANKENVGPQQGPTDYSAYCKWIDSTATSCTNASTIIVSTDPISAEVEGIKIMRINANTAYVVTPDKMPAYLQNCAGLGSNIANMGIINESNMSIQILKNVASSINVPEAGASGIEMYVSAAHLPGRDVTYVQYAVPSDMIGRDVLFRIYDAKGGLVRSISDKAIGALSHFSWDERDASRNLAGPGNYVVRFMAGGMRAASRFAIVR